MFCLVDSDTFCSLGEELELSVQVLPGGPSLIITEDVRFLSSLCVLENAVCVSLCVCVCV